MCSVTTLKIVLINIIAKRTCSKILGIGYRVLANLLSEPRCHECGIDSHLQEFEFNDTSHDRILHWFKHTFDVLECVQDFK